MDDFIKTSHSEVESFVICERRHYYSYGMELQSKTPSQALVRGLVGHAALEAYYTAIKNGDKNERTVVIAAINRAMDEANAYDDIGQSVLAEIIDLIQEYAARYFKEDRTWEIISVEDEFNVPIGDGYFIKMFVDLIAKTWDGLVVLDHKFVYDFYGIEEIALNPQLVKYKAALESEGYSVDKLMYNQIRYRVTKDNRNNPDAKFRREFVDVNSIRQDRVLKEQLEAAKRIDRLKSMPLNEWEDSVVRTASSIVCKRCPFKVICGMELAGKDISKEIDFTFEKKRGR